VFPELRDNLRGLRRSDTFLTIAQAVLYVASIWGLGWVVADSIVKMIRDPKLLTTLNVWVTILWFVWLIGLVGEREIKSKLARI
jgi:hypothetical protein